MEFEWDPAKSHETLRRRRFDFNFAARVFDGVTIEGIDSRRDYGEIRVCAIGQVDGQILVVVYADRVSGRRIISARPASRKERLTWNEQFG